MLERRKVYIEFTGASSVLLVTPYRSKEYQLKPTSNYLAFDMLTLKPCDPRDDRYFWAQVNYDEKDKTYAITLYVLSAENNFSSIGVVMMSDNKQKFEVTYQTKE